MNLHLLLHISGMVATAMGVFSIAILNEAIKRLRISLSEERIFTFHKTRNSHDTTIEQLRDSEANENSALLVPTSNNTQCEWLKYFRGKLPTKDVIFDEMLYSIQNLLSYALMLVAMTYSFYLFAAVIVGMVIGKI